MDHRYASENEPLLILPQNEPIWGSIHGFDQRKPGYIYHVRAKFNVLANPPQDGADRWFNFTQVISEEKYQGNETFTITLIKSIVPGGPVITLQKTDDKYYFIQDKLQLTYGNDLVRDQMEEIWQNALQIRDSWEKDRQQVQPKWRFIRAIVTHDPGNFGKAYLVQRIEFLM